ncbi:MAG: hypothetical protein M3R38_36840 [Actinomycetota bacterium]|nr:hypothetical protein [Actinomycetota bacterium]
MGGSGSGNRHRFDKKATTGEAQSLDVRYLHREGLLKPWLSFSLQWSRAGRETGSIGGMVEGTPGDLPERVVLSYCHRSGAGGKSEDIKESVPLEWTPCNFGGERPWFICPGAGCGRRVAVLYGPGRYFLCRHCYDLRYESQRENGTHRALRRAQKIREGLGGSANMTEPFPERPKGMHRRTYERLWWEHHQAETEQLAGMRAWLDGLERKIG